MYAHRTIHRIAHHDGSNIGSQVSGGFDINMTIDLLILHSNKRKCHK